MPRSLIFEILLNLPHLLIFNGQLGEEELEESEFTSETHSSLQSTSLLRFLSSAITITSPGRKFQVYQLTK